MKRLSLASNSSMLDHTRAFDIIAGMTALHVGAHPRSILFIHNSVSPEMITAPLRIV